MKKILLTLMVMFIMTMIANAATIEITDNRATPDYWTKPEGDTIRLNSTQIRQLNHQMRIKNAYAASLFKYPTRVSLKNLRDMIQKTWTDESDGAFSGLYMINHSPITRSYFDAVLANRALDSINADAYGVEVKYAVATDRIDLRLLPTADGWFDNPSFPHYDSLQGTVIDPAEAVAVLHTSSDGKFAFVQAQDYFGWVDVNKIAFTDRTTWESYARPKDFLVVTANKKTIKVNGRNILFQMGAVIPLIQTTVIDEQPSKNETPPMPIEDAVVSVGIKLPAFPNVISTQNLNSEWIVRMPVAVNGRLVEKYITIADDDTINKGWLPCTSNNFIRQAFKFLGDEYGWGGMNQSVDCSSFVQDVYRTMGIFIPRDANQQVSVMPLFAVFNDVDTYDRYKIVSRAPIGSLLFKPGHVLMYLGTDANGTPLVIHSASSYFANGQKIFIRKVIVSDLTYRNGAGVATIDGLTDIASVISGH